MNRFITALILILFVASAGKAADASLDQERVRALYNDADFDGVLDMIGRFRSRNPAYGRDDSIFIAKHLAVIYAANPRSVGQGKFWMNELLKLMPAADLVGMYVSDEIDRIFEKVREEFLTRQGAFGIDTSKLVLPSRPASGNRIGGEVAAVQPEQGSGGQRGAGQDSAGGPGEASGRAGKGEASESASGKGRAGLRMPGRKAFWVLGGTAAVAAAAGVTAYFLLASSGESEPPEYVIPKGSAP